MIPDPVSLKLDFQAAPGNQPDRQPVHASVRGLQEHLLLVDATKAPLECLLVVYRFLDDHLRQSSREAPVVIHASQRTIQSWRRNLERIVERQRVLNVENR